jgi:hypothetical protein
VNALSIPEGRLMANACACESPTITIRAGPAGCTGATVTGADDVAVDEAVTPASGVATPDGEMVVVAAATTLADGICTLSRSIVTSSPPAARSKLATPE